MRRALNPRSLGRMLGREFDSSFLRFLAVGLSNFAVSFSVFRGLLALPWAPAFKAAACQVASYAAGTVWSFTWNRRFTFKSTASIPKQAARFVVLQAGLALVSSGLMGLLVDARGLPASPTWFFVMGAVTIGNFVLCKRWVFQQADRRKEQLS